MTVELRPVVADDDSFLFEVYASTRHDEMAAWGWDAAQRDGFLRMQFMMQRNAYAMQFPEASHDIILLDEKPVGRMIVARHDYAIRFVDFALLPEARGKGIGTRLFREVLDEAAATSRPCLLKVLKANPRAVQLYERLGFVNTGEDAIYVDMEWRSA